MKILFDDLIQRSDAPMPLKSASLADKLEDDSLVIVLDSSYEIDCFGVGNTDATEVTINGQTITLGTNDEKNGLYLLDTSLNTDTINLSHDGTFIGRFALGKSRSLGASPSREPGFYSTSSPRITASGQVIPGGGGISGRKISVDFRYKIDQEIFEDIDNAYLGQISKGLPFFILFDKENHRFPWLRLYASADNEQTFQSSVNRFLYSRRFDFIERF